MNAIIQSILMKQDKPVLLLVLVLISLNILLTAAKSILEKLAPVTKSSWDDACLSGVDKTLIILHRILSFMSANTTALPEDVKAVVAHAQATGEIPVCPVPSSEGPKV